MALARLQWRETKKTPRRCQAGMSPLLSAARNWEAAEVQQEHEPVIAGRSGAKPEEFLHLGVGQMLAWLVDEVGSVGPMSGNEPSEAERAGLEAVRAVVNVTDHEWLVPSGNGGTADWRVWLDEGRVVDVEVTTNTDGEGLSFFDVLSADGRGKKWPDPRLRYKWMFFVASSRTNQNHSMKKLVAALRDWLVLVEARGGTAEQMAREADRQLIDPATYLNRHGGRRSLRAAERRGVSLEDWCAHGSDYWYPRLLVGHYRDCRTSTPDVSVLGKPELLGNGKGVVQTIPCWTDGGTCYDALAPAIQHAIDNKTKKRQLDNAPDLKWLAVKLNGIPGLQLGDAFGPSSHPPHPTLEGVSFSYFDEVWAFAIAAENFVVLRISEGGTRQQHHIVSRSETVASG